MTTSGLLPPRSSKDLGRCLATTCCSVSLERCDLLVGLEGFQALRIVGCGGGGRSVPGVVDSVVGRRPNTGVHLGRLINQKLACNSGTRTFCSAQKRCNSNGAISTFEIRVRELHATFLRNHNMRRHKGTTKCPKQKTTQAQKTPTTPTAATTTTSTGALHPLCGGAPVTWRCTRTEEVHCLRIGCSAPTYKNKRGTGTPNHSPPHPSMRSWALLVAGRARRPRHHLHPGPLRHLPHPYMRRAGFHMIAVARCTSGLMRD